MKEFYGYLSIVVTLFLCKCDALVTEKSRITYLLTLLCGSFCPLDLLIPIGTPKILTASVVTFSCNLYAEFKTFLSGNGYIYFYLNSDLFSLVLLAYENR